MSKNFILILKYQRFGQSNCFSPPLPPLVSYGSPCLSATFQSTIVLPIQQDKLLSVNIPLWICFVKGNISKCNGCKSNYHHRGGSRGVFGVLRPPPEIYQRSQKNDVLV